MMTEYQIVQWWLRNDENRKIELSHGGKGGTFYARLVNADGSVLSDGTGDTPEDAMGSCARGVRIEDLMRESESR